jgi:hypothetical protein
MQFNEQLAPGVTALRAHELANRATGFLGITRTIAGQELVLLTPRHRLRLILMSNAFLLGLRPRAGDVIELFWELSPWNPANGGRAGFMARFRRELMRLRLKAQDETGVILAALAYLGDMMADSPRGVEDFSLTAEELGQYCHWITVESSFYVQVHGGFTVESYLRTPYLVLNQLWRCWKILHPDLDDDGHPLPAPFVDRSERLVGSAMKAKATDLTGFFTAPHSRLEN